MLRWPIILMSNIVYSLQNKNLRLCVDSTNILAVIYNEYKYKERHIRRLIVYDI